MKLKVKKLDDRAKLPTRGSSSAAGWDLYALEDADIDGGCMMKMRTGIAVEIPEGYFGAIYARSSLATKKKLRPANCVGVIDSDYRGELIVALHNDSVFAQANDVSIYLVRTHIAAGERIAQLVIQKYEEIEIEEVDELSETERGEGGFGSTGSR